MKAFIACIALSVLVFISSCSPTAPDNAENNRGEDCLLGEWKFVENGVTKSMSFNSDSTGQEVMSASDVRPYRWTSEGNKVSITYDGDPTHKNWDFVINCETNQISMFGMAY